MTSITKCYPRRSKSGSGDRVPSRREQLLCRSFIEGEIAFLNPELIMPVGRLAIDYFFPSKPALKEVIGEFPNAFVIMLTSVVDMETVKRCLDLGAANYILKDTPLTEMKQMIKETWTDFRRKKE